MTFDQLAEIVAEFDEAGMEVGGESSGMCIYGGADILTLDLGKALWDSIEGWDQECDLPLRCYTVSEDFTEKLCNVLRFHAESLIAVVEKVFQRHQEKIGKERTIGEP